MKKVIILSILILSINACSAGENKAMQNMLEGWVGENVEKAVKSWGQPNKVSQDVEGVKYTWREVSYTTTSNENLGSIYDPQNYTPQQTTMMFDAYKSGDFTKKIECSRTFETDNTGKIIKATYKGNACPVTSLGTNKWKNK